jgi:hypothetical protein
VASARPSRSWAGAGEASRQAPPAGRVRPGDSASSRGIGAVAILANRRRQAATNSSVLATEDAASTAAF